MRHGRVARAEEIVLQLGRGERPEAHGARGVRLLSQNRSRRNGDGCVRLCVVHVAQHERRAWEPRGETQRRHVRDQMKVAVSKLPRSEEHTSELQSLAYLVCRLLL